MNLLMQNKKFTMLDNSFEFNKFDLVFDEIEDGLFLKKVLQ